MNTKLQELTDKLRTEGVEKGKNEAADIIAKAKADAENIIANANKTAATIIEQANEEAKDIDKKTKSELRLFANQSVSALKTEVTNIISDKIVRDSVSNVVSDTQFMHSIIAKIAESWSREGGANIDTNDANALESYFIANAKALLDNGITINEIKGKKTQFTITPKNGGYKINCGEEEFIAYFKEFIRAKLLDMLF